MNDGLNRFYNSLIEATNRTPKELVGLFAYFLTVEQNQETVTSADIDRCFESCDLTPPRRTAAYLSEGVQDNRFVKVSRGYKLQRHYRQELSKLLGTDSIVVQASAELRRLETKLPTGLKKSFLKETIDCFEIGANRATIIMCWILVVDHLADYVFDHHLDAFNQALASNTDRRVKVSNIKSRDDLSEIPDVKFIEFLRSARIIDGDVRKILDQKLGTRNSCAHPSGVTVSKTKVVDFVEDLVNNVILKYQI